MRRRLAGLFLRDATVLLRRRYILCGTIRERIGRHRRSPCYLLVPLALPGALPYSSGSREPTTMVSGLSSRPDTAILAKAWHYKFGADDHPGSPANLHYNRGGHEYSCCCREPRDLESTVMQSREASDIIVQQTPKQAALEEVPFSELERRMMYFTENEEMSEDPLKLNSNFEAEYDCEEYEAKISVLMHHA